MISKQNVEKFYDCLDASANVLYETLKQDYLTGITNSIENIIANDVLQNVDEETYNKLISIYESIDGYEFRKEEIRKAVQLCILKGFKHRRVFNGDMTPDTIAILMNFIISKFFNQKPLRVLDPMVGTSNLLATIANNTENEISFVGVDINEEMVNIAKAMMNILDYDIELYLQDTLTGVPGFFDLIVSDLPDLAMDETYVPGEVVRKYLFNLKEESPMILLIPNTFFDNTSKEDILEIANLEGLIKLPNEIFKQGYEKSILILTKKSRIPRTEFLLLDLESLTDKEVITDAMRSIDSFFKRR